MSELSDLRRQVEQMQREYNRLSKEAERERKENLKESRRRMREYEKEMEQAMRDHNVAAQQKYAELLHQYEESTSMELQAGMAQMSVQYQKLRQDMGDAQRALENKMRELDRAVQEFRSEGEERDERNKQDAKACLRGAEAAFNALRSRPHAKFKPGRMQIFHQQIKDGLEFYKNGLYEAAAATGVGAQSGLERLRYDLDDAEDEWRFRYGVFEHRLRLLRARTSQEFADWERCAACESGGDKKKRARSRCALAYWSEGVYQRTCEVGKRHAGIVTRCEKLGEDVFLKSDDAPSVQDLDKYAGELDKADKKLAQASELARNRYLAACERSDWGERLVDFGSNELNLEWLESETGFEEPPQDVLSSSEFQKYMATWQLEPDCRQDLRRWLRLVFENAAGNRIFVYIVPIELGTAVSNRIILHIDYGGAEQAAYSAEMLEHVRDALALFGEQAQGAQYVPDVRELEQSAAPALVATGRDLSRRKRAR